MNNYIGKNVKLNELGLSYGTKSKMVSIIAFFKYKKDNNLYAVCVEDTNIPYGLVYYGTAHIKGDNLIVIGSKNPIQEVPQELLFKLNNNQELEDFEIQNIDNINSIELITPNKIEIKKEVVLDAIEKCVPKPVIDNDNNKGTSKVKKKNSALPLLLILIFLLLGVGGYFYFFSGNDDAIIDKSFTCTMTTYDRSINANVFEDNTYYFNNNDILEYVNISSKYTFLYEDEYNDFMDRSLYYNYLKDDSGFSTNNDELSFTILERVEIDEDYSQPTNYEEALNYYKKKNYDCIEELVE